MTSDRGRKMAIRAHAAEHGLTYQQAMRALHPTPAPDPDRPVVAACQWWEYASVRFLREVKCGNGGPEYATRVFRPGETVRMGIRGGDDKPVAPDVWWSSSDVDLAFIVAFDAVEVVDWCGGRRPNGADFRTEFGKNVTGELAPRSTVYPRGIDWTQLLGKPVTATMDTGWGSKYGHAGTVVDVTDSPDGPVLRIERDGLDTDVLVAAEWWRFDPAPPLPAAYDRDRLRRLLRLHPLVFDKAEQQGLLPSADGADRFDGDDADQALKMREEIVAKVCTMGDLGAVRAAEELSARLEMDVTPHAVEELARQGHLRLAPPYKGHRMFNGHDLEAFHDIKAASVADHDGRQHMTDGLPELLGVRRSDVDALITRGWLKPVRRANSQYSRRKVPLYRRGDIDALLIHPDIDWDTVRATPRGRRSPLLDLPPR